MAECVTDDRHGSAKSTAIMTCVKSSWMHAKSAVECLNSW
jgi:hypothetical protein